MTGTLVAAFLAGAFGFLLLPQQQGPGHAVARPASRGAAGSPAPGDAVAGIADPALMLDLVAAMLDAGQSLLPALGVLADVVDPHTAWCLRRVQSALELGAPWAVAWELAEPGPGTVFVGSPGPVPARKLHRKGTSLDGSSSAAQLREALTFMATTGAPSAAVLLAAAAQLRRKRSREAERRAAALGVRLVVPLGLCGLPAFIVLTVVPLLLSLLPSIP